MSAAGEAVRQAMGAPPSPAPFAWHDPDALSALLEPHGFSVEVTHHHLSVAGPSPVAYFDAESRNHPMILAALAALDRGQSEALRHRVLQILEEGNEDPAAFQVTSRYVVAMCRRKPSK
jgi:hypothetical protein